MVYIVLLDLYVIETGVLCQSLLFPVSETAMQT